MATRPRWIRHEHSAGKRGKTIKCEISKEGDEGDAPIPVSRLFNPIQARLFLLFKCPSGGGEIFRGPLMISGTIKASPMKLCTVIVLLKAYQNTKRNFQKYDLDVTMTSLLKPMAKFGPPRNQANYISFER